MANILVLDGTGDFVDLALGNAGPASTDAFCIGLCFKRGTNTTWDGLFSFLNASNVPVLALELQASGAGGQIELSINNGALAAHPVTSPSAISVVAADGYVLLFITCGAPSSNSIPRFHLYEGGAWAHRDAGANLTALTNGPITKIRVGRFDNTSSDDADSRLIAGVAAKGTGANLNDATIETLDGATITDWLNALPSGGRAGWLFNSTSSITDQSGGSANSTAISGNPTIVTNDDPSSSIFSFGAVDASVTAPPADGAGDTPDPAISAGSSVTTGPADGTGAIPAPTITTSSDASVTTPPADGVGDTPDPAVSASSELTSPPADGTGTIPPVNSLVSVEVTPGPAIAEGSIPAPSVSGSGDAEVDSPPADGTGDVPAPAVTADATATAPAADATGDTPAPTISASSDITAPPADGVGDIPATAVTADSAVTAPVADGTGDAPAPSVSGGASVTAPPIDGAGDLPVPTIEGLDSLPPLVGIGEDRGATFATVGTTSATFEQPLASASVERAVTELVLA